MSAKPTFGTILRRELDRAGISVADFAKRVEVKRATIYNLLNDTHGPSFALVDRIATALGVPTDTFRAGADAPPG